MGRLKKKLKNSSGATMILSLALFLICGMVSAVILTSAGVNSGRIVTQRSVQEASFSVSSAAALLKESIGTETYSVETYSLSGGQCGNDTAPGDVITIPSGEFSDLLVSLCDSGSFPSTCTLTINSEALTVTGTVTMDEYRNIAILLDTHDSDAEKYPMMLTFTADFSSFSSVSNISHQYNTGETDDDGQPIYGVCDYTLTKTVTVTSWDAGTISKGGT